MFDYRTTNSATIAKAEKIADEARERAYNMAMCQLNQGEPLVAALCFLHTRYREIDNQAKGIS